jgi:DNA-binding NarL/FixJ family response regulator
MSKQNAPPITATPKGRILSTEDDPDTRDLLRLLLQLEGFELAYADNAEEALSLARTSHFDLYLLDNWVSLVSLGKIYAENSGTLIEPHLSSFTPVPDTNLIRTALSAPVLRGMWSNQPTPMSSPVT